MRIIHPYRIQDSHEIFFLLSAPGPGLPGAPPVFYELRKEHEEILIHTREICTCFLDPDNQCLLVHLSETSGDVRVFPCGYCPGTKKHSGVHPGIQKKPVYRKQYPGTGKREKRLWCRAFRLPGRSSSRPDCGHLYSLFFRLAKIPSDGVPYTHFVLAALLISP